MIIKLATIQCALATIQCALATIQCALGAQECGNTNAFRHRILPKDILKIY